MADGTERFGRRRQLLRLCGVGLGTSMMIAVLFAIRRGDTGYGGLWVVLLGLVIALASVEFGPDEVAVEPHAIVVRGGARLRRSWTTRFERGEVVAARLEGWWLRIERTDGEQLRYWLRSHDRPAIAAALQRFEDRVPR